MSYSFRIYAYRTSYRTLFTKKELDREWEKPKEGTMPKLESQSVSYVFESVFSALLLTLMCLHWYPDSTIYKDTNLQSKE